VTRPVPRERVRFGRAVQVRALVCVRWLVDDRTVVVLHAPHIALLRLRPRTKMRTLLVRLVRGDGRGKGRRGREGGAQATHQIRAARVGINDRVP